MSNYAPQNHSSSSLHYFSSRSWREIVIAVAPGILCIMQMYVAADGTYPLFTALVLQSVFLVVPVIVYIKSRHLPLWTIPGMGGVFWEVRTILVILYGSRGMIFIDIALKGMAILSVLLLIATELFPVWQFPKKSLRTMGALILLMAIVSSFEISAYHRWLSTFITILLKWLQTILPFVIFGYFLAKKQGFPAVLFIAVCAPFWLGQYLAPEQVVCTQTALCQGVLYAVPLLIFMVVFPILILLSKNLRNQRFWIVIISFLGVAVPSFSRIVLTNSTDAVFIFPNPILWIYFVIVLWSPILISVLIYDIRYQEH